MNTLNKALDILEVFTQNPGNESFRLRDVARLSRKNKVTVRRLMSVLVARGYLSQPEKRGKYLLGPKLAAIRNAMTDDNLIKDVAKSYMLELNEMIKESVVLVKWNGKEAFFLEEINNMFPLSPLRIIPDQSSITPLSCSAAGKIFLSSLSEKDLDEYFKKNKIIAHTPNTITDVNLLKSHLMLVARDGVAYDDEELHIGVRNVSAGIRNSQGKIAYAIGITAPSARLSRNKMIEIATDIKRCSLEISRALGYRPQQIEEMRK